MNADIQKEMYLYFDELAEEYDDFYAGKGPVIQHCAAWINPPTC